MGKVFTAFIALLMLFGCGVEKIETVILLNPPLGLQATNYNLQIVNNQTTNYLRCIKLEFWALNNETYFSGFKIYVADTKDDLISSNFTGTYRQLSNTAKMSNEATLYNGWSSMTEAKKVVYYFTNDANGTSPIVGKEYYFHIRSYSKMYKLASPPSNPVGLTFTNG